MPEFQLINSGVRTATTGALETLDRNYNVLVLSLAHMGDLVLGLPAIYRLKQKLPNSDLDIVVGDYNVSLAGELKLFRSIYSYNFFQPKSSIDPTRQPIEEGKFLRSLPSYDIAVDLRRPPDTRFFLLKVRAAIKAGFTTFSPLDEHLDVCLSTDDVNYEFGKAKQHNLSSISLQLLSLIDSLPLESLTIPPVGPQVEPENAIAMFPFAGQELKEWPIEHFVELAMRVLSERLFETVNVYVSARESERAQPFAAIPGVVLQTGLGVHELIEHLPGNRVAVANNSFGAHLASLLRVPLVGIYSGHETWLEWQPILGKNALIYSDLNCSPCHIGDRSECPFDLLCLRQISVDYVIDQLKAMRNTSRQNSSETFNYVPLK